MADVILFGLVGEILSKLAPYVLNQISLPFFVKKEIKKLKDRISTIRNVLLHAQDLQNSNIAIKEWLQRLKIILYEAEDFFDEVATEALRRDLVINKSTTRKVRYFFTSSNPVIFHYSLGQKIKDIRERLDEICTDMKDFGFLVQPLDKPIIKRNEGTTSFVDTQRIIGRDGDKETLLQLLFSSPNDENVHVIPIVGMGGLGKTTLAQMIFSDISVKNHFDKKLWVCVSDDFNLKIILAEILKAIGENVTNAEVEQLQISFREKLSGTKFFLVLDDVWNDDPVEWKKLEELLMTGARGSRILVTTRDKKVAKIVRTVDPYVLKGLSENECLSIFSKWAFEKGGETKHPDLIEIGREIVKKCGGVPLAARTLGVLLYSKTSRKEWLLVRDNEMWAQVQNENDIIPILKLSYDQMPSYLKECFGYCSIFQKDEKFQKEKLMYHWIAHGYIQSPNKNVELEDVCETYLEELLRRYFLEYVNPNDSNKKNDMVYYKMHDIVHDLATYVVGDEIQIIKRENVSAASERVRHVSSYHFSKIPSSLREGKSLRTIMSRVAKDFYDQEEVLHLHSRCLRVLDCVTEDEVSAKRLSYLWEFFFTTQDVTTMPANELDDVTKSIKKMKYLRYLSILGVKTIPKSFCELLNLQYLKLHHSFFDTIPETFGNLRNLRVLIISSSKLICLPEGIRSLTSLRTLKIYKSSKLRSLGTGLGCITSLQHLEIELCELLKFSNSDFQGLTSLKYLVLSSLDRLKQLHMGLQGVAATLEHLEIYSCPILEFSNSDFQGLTSLKYLELSYLPGLKQLPTGLQDAAATLKHLALKLCHNLKLTEEVLPNLSSLEILTIWFCLDITCLPEGMQRLGKLNILEIYGKTSLAKRVIPTGEDWPKISHVPRIFVNGWDVKSL